jgi:hypothetical protein
MIDRRHLAVILAFTLILAYQLAIGHAQEHSENQAQSQPEEVIIVGPENNFVKWEPGKDIVIPQVQQGGTIFRPKITIEWEGPKPPATIGVENFIQQWGDILITQIECDNTRYRPKSVSIEWENIPILPENVIIPEEARPTVIPIENVRPPDIRIPKENFENLSPWQQYVTPNAPAVRDLARRISSIEGAYERAVSWIWVSDRTLNGVEEKWLFPQNFLTDTPNYPTNPIPGETVSDCESQAYTLVSVIRAMGMPPENVRVAVGKVQFGEQAGGHAWAEIYVHNKWMALEATSGPYWDDDTHSLIERNGIPFDYFGHYEYPSIEIWGYFNDKYFYNPWTGEGNAPPHWQTARPPSNLLLMLLYLIIFVALAVLIVEIALIVQRKKPKRRLRKAPRRK